MNWKEKLLRSVPSIRIFPCSRTCPAQVRRWHHACWRPLVPNGSVIRAPRKSDPSAGLHPPPRAAARNTGSTYAKLAPNSSVRAFTNGPGRPFASVPGRGPSISSSVIEVKATTLPSAPSPPSGFEFCIGAGKPAHPTTNPFTLLLLPVPHHPCLLPLDKPRSPPPHFF